MNILIAGVMIWIIAHLVPSVARGPRQGLVDRLGPGLYRGLFSLIIVAALVLIVVGWRSTPEQYLYVLPPWSRLLGFVLMFIAFVLLGAAHYKTAIKRAVRHPMLMGVFVWSLGHLLTNGTTRALILFGGLGVWALIEMPLINAREGAVEAAEGPGMAAELK
ncbi:MAG: NnrU family protein, partial [Woeseiaceae bacterium]